MPCPVASDCEYSAQRQAILRRVNGELLIFIDRDFSILESHPDPPLRISVQNPAPILRQTNPTPEISPFAVPQTQHSSALVVPHRTSQMAAGIMCDRVYVVYLINIRDLREGEFAVIFSSEFERAPNPDMTFSICVQTEDSVGLRRRRGWQLI